MKSLYAVLFFFAAITSGMAQTITTTTGNCSPIVTDNSAAVKIECTGVDPAFQKQVVDLLNELLKKQIDPQTVTKRLDEIAKGVEDLNVKSVDASRGIISIYQFNGAKLEKYGNRTISTGGPELATFQEIQNLYNQADWRALAEKCDAQIVKTPEWLTPYLYSGVAHGKLGEKAIAIEKLEFVVKHAGSDPSYVDAARNLAILKAGN